MLVDTPLVVDDTLQRRLEGVLRMEDSVVVGGIHVGRLQYVLCMLAVL